MVGITAVEPHRIGMPLVRAYETSFGRQTARDVLLVHVMTDVGDGWGECVAMAGPVYSSEYVSGCEAMLRDYLLPALLAAGEVTAEYFGAVRDRVDSGVSVGIGDSIDALLDEVDGYLDGGHLHITLKLEPGWDLEPVRAVRELIGDTMLQVDANTAYSLADVEHLAGLDEFGRLLFEHPFPAEDLAAHVHLARAITTPVCLDESIVSAELAVDAIERGATSIVNINAGRARQRRRGSCRPARRVGDQSGAVDRPGVIVTLKQ